jgi:hypothetical protein
LTKKEKIILLILHSNGFGHVHPILLLFGSCYRTKGILTLLSPLSPVREWVAARFKHV